MCSICIWKKFITSSNNLESSSNCSIGGPAPCQGYRFCIFLTQYTTLILLNFTHAQEKYWQFNWNQNFNHQLDGFLAFAIEYNEGYFCARCKSARTSPPHCLIDNACKWCLRGYCTGLYVKNQLNSFSTHSWLFYDFYDFQNRPVSTNLDWFLSCTIPSAHPAHSPARIILFSASFSNFI